MNKLMFASVISEIKQSDVFMTVKARICEAPEANLNGARVTEAFIDEIVSNEARYVGLPLYADVKSLISGKYNRLGHLYDSKSGEFHSTQIGSFYQFEKEELEEGCALIGYARIPKRNKKLSKAISELFADNALKFSFELAVGEYEELDDHTILIDASENNYLEGTAIVTFPACEEAVALQLVAQQADDRKGDAGMAEVQNLAEIQEVEETVETAEAEQTVETAEQDEAKEEVSEVAEEKSEEAEETEETSEENAACKKKNAEEESEESENAACKKEEKNAEVYVHEGYVEEHTTCAYDSETGKDVCQTVRVETHVSEPVEGNLVDTDNGPAIAEAGGDAPVETPAETPVETPVETPAETPAEEPVQTPAETPAKAGGDPIEDVEVVEVEDNKKTAEQLIAELAQVVEALKQEVAELKEQKVNAEVKKVSAEVNPFMADINSTGKYSLLQKEEKRSNSYSLLGKA